MKLNLSILNNVDFPGVKEKVEKVGKDALKDLVVDIARDAIDGSPVLTGNNRRSIMYEVGPGGEVAKNAMEGAVYSTSGYGGYLETGTGRMPARPYMKPALDKNLPKFEDKIKANMEGPGL